MREKLPAALLWDMDGTAVDTETYWVEAEQDMAAQFGATWSQAQALQLIGNGLLESARTFKAATGIDLPASEVVDWWISAVRQRVVTEGAPWRPGARELMQLAARHGIKQALVTSSYAVLAHEVAQQAGVFSVIVSGDQVSQLKPAPEGYLTACDLLGVEPSQCVAFEDSPAGVRAAVAAGTRAVAVPFMVDLPRLPQLSWVDSLGQVDIPVLARLAAGEVIDLTK
ncbi:HAD family hydrolase [Buchananella hordeovulneris]|uniref:HAD family hydrolase n=1 Tax=Buchananella hordeovulneris TaxID=52770 RepID=UPI000F5FF814|nr:HAD family phosphatase [Buchananella hordeovulneris]RRD45500.1 HAD family phosphatase [Buchananella hordeovulneris]RRD50475.1 HAD family phosphatase [Buchananella hordeovulneris]